MAKIARGIGAGTLLFFGCLLLYSASSCKKRNILASQNIRVLNNFPVKLSLVSEDFKVPEEFSPELIPFREEFLTLAKAQNITIAPEVLNGLRTMIFVDELDKELDPHTAAICVTRVAKRQNIGGRQVTVWKEIHVKNAFLAQYPLESKGFKAVIMHELFHCLMNKGHFAGGKGIMNAVLDLSDPHFLGNLETYLKEMFHPKVIASMPDRPKAKDVKKSNFEGPIRTLRKITGSG